MSKVNILGINISNYSKKEILNKIDSFLKDIKKHQIVTVNPEYILSAQKDEEFFYILNKASLAVADGVALKFAAWLTGYNIKRITGADLVKDILKTAEQKNYKVAILNWNQGLSNHEEIRSTILKKYSGLNLYVENVARNSENNVSKELHDFSPDILFSSLGAPFQDILIYRFLKKLPNCKIGMGVGGSFDYMTGKTRRAPVFLRFLGLEWLWRLILQPKRFKRIYKAVIVFPFKLIIWKTFLPFLYRPNVACILYKKENNQYKILLVKRSERINHWQLPQGGTDHLSTEEAGLKELEEELGTKSIKPVASYKNLYKYHFQKELAKYNPQMHIGYKGQKQGLLIAEFTGQDKEIVINYWDHNDWKWVDAENLINEVHDIRKESAKIYLNIFNNLIKNKKIYPVE